LVRRPARQRATGFAEVGIPLIAAFWPIFPFWLSVILSWLATRPSGVSIARFADSLKQWLLVNPSTSINVYLLGCGLIVLGNSLDIWAYLALRRSLSIVAEARELVTTGPYRWVRHPVYLGQIIAQAGVWLALRPKPLWIAYYLIFVALQLFRARVEDR